MQNNKILKKIQNNIVIERENVTKFLGALIDENLSWKQHINNVCTKISKSIGTLYKFRGILKKTFIKTIVFFFLHCHLNYANIAYNYCL